MKKYKVISPISNGGKIIKVGETIELSDKFAYLVGSNLELIVPEKPVEQEETKPTNKRSK